MYSPGSGQGPVVSFWEHVNEPSGSIKVKLSLCLIN
jgi:hypothetical protein